MVYYETMYIVHPALEAGRLKDLIQSIEKDLIDLGGTIHITDVWGKKKLAYSINKEKYGMYVLIQFEADGSKNKEFNLGLDHNSNILAYLTTKIDKGMLLSGIESLDKQLGILQPSEPSQKITTESNNEDQKSEIDSSDEEENVQDSTDDKGSNTNENQEEN